MGCSDYLRKKNLDKFLDFSKISSKIPKSSKLMNINQNGVHSNKKSYVSG